MKRSALILLTAIYLLSLVGIGVSRFYCCGELTSVKLTYAVTDHSDKDNCCKNDVKSFKVKDTHINATSFALSDLSSVILPADHKWTFITVITSPDNQSGYQQNAPPGSVAVPIYALNCTYRI